MIGLKQLVKRTAYRLAPTWARACDERMWFKSRTRRLLKVAARCGTNAERYAALRGVGLGALQKEKEIVPLLDAISAIEPRRLCEIGSYDGGTLFLFAQAAHPSAHLISLDLEFGGGRGRYFPTFARPGQRVTCIQADSHQASTRDLVGNQLGNEQLDVLFIDGDHSLDGVTRDFELFSPLVRKGGLIAFHDIVPDYRTRFGTPTASNGGEVWKLWESLKARCPQTQEFFEQGPEQDGYGIGLIRWV